MISFPVDITTVYAALWSLTVVTLFGHCGHYVWSLWSLTEGQTPRHWCVINHNYMDCEENFQRLVLLLLLLLLLLRYFCVVRAECIAGITWLLNAQNFNRKTSISNFSVKRIEQTILLLLLLLLLNAHLVWTAVGRPANQKTHAL